MLLLSILVIEDDEELAAEIVEYLGRCGHEARACSNVADARMALASAIAADRPPHAILCDIGLPDGSGIDLYLAFASELPATRWILASGDGESITRLEDVALAGARPPTFVEKPVSLRDLDRLVRDKG